MTAHAVPVPASPPPDRLGARMATGLPPAGRLVVVAAEDLARWDGHTVVLALAMLPRWIGVVVTSPGVPHGSWPRAARRQSVAARVHDLSTVDPVLASRACDLALVWVGTRAAVTSRARTCGLGVIVLVPAATRPVDLAGTVLRSLADDVAQRRARCSVRVAR